MENKIKALTEIVSHLIKYIERQDRMKYVPHKGFLRPTCFNCLDEGKCENRGFVSCEEWRFNNDSKG